MSQEPVAYLPTPCLGVVGMSDCQGRVEQVLGASNAQPSSPSPSTSLVVTTVGLGMGDGGEGVLRILSSRPGSQS